MDGSFKFRFQVVDNVRISMKHCSARMKRILKNMFKFSRLPCTSDGSRDKAGN